MRLACLITVVLLVSSMPAFAAEDAAPFPGLRTVDVRSNSFEIRVHYDPAITTVINERFKESGFSWVKVLTTKIDRKKNQLFEIRYTDGPSGDPAFWILNNGKELDGVGGTELYLPGNGSVYVTGHTNGMFNHRRKFELKGEKLTEVQQPFYYVGLDSKALRDITIYSDMKLARPVANIPVGSKLSVLASEGDFYLIKTQFGLLGWIRFKPENLADNLIEGLYFAGD